MPKINPMETIAQVAMNASPIGALIGKVLNRPDVPMDNAKVPATVAKVQTAMADAGMAVVAVKSGWMSKINWAALVMEMVNAPDVFNRGFPTDFKAAVQTFLQVGLPPLIIIIRQFYTSTVTKSSMVPPITKE